MKRILFAALPFLVDRLTKSWAIKELSSSPLSVCPGIELILTWNRGISWSMFTTLQSSGFWVLTAFIAIITGMFICYTIWRLMHKLPVFLEMLVLGGAISNLIDRFWYGAVVDFIDLYVGNYHWPTFNLADAFIVMGISGICIRSWWSSYEHNS